MSTEVAETLHEIGGVSQAWNNRPGLWAARVEDIDDPRRNGRARVRVFHVHGDKRSTHTTGLPWCSVLDHGGGGHDYGSGGCPYPVGWL